MDGGDSAASNNRSHARGSLPGPSVTRDTHDRCCGRPRFPCKSPSSSEPDHASCRRVEASIASWAAVGLVAPCPAVAPDSGLGCELLGAGVFATAWLGSREADKPCGERGLPTSRPWTARPASIVPTGPEPLWVCPAHSASKRRSAPDCLGQVSTSTCQALDAATRCWPDRRASQPPEGRDGEGCGHRACAAAEGNR
jgi:hypothetical protein